MLLSLLLGVSNGLVGSLPMILAPNKVADHNRELCGQCRQPQAGRGREAARNGVRDRKEGREGNGEL